MTRDIDIANMALSHIACEPIQTWQDGSESSRLIGLHYDTCRRELLRQFPWTFAKITDKLILANFHLPRWEYTYTTPLKCLRIIRIFPESAAGVPDVRIPFEGCLANDGHTKIIGTDCEGAYIEYIYDVTDTTAYDPLFVEALSYKLAFEINRAKTNDGDLTNELYQRFREALENAKHASTMEVYSEVKWPHDYLSFRRGARPWHRRRRI